MLLKSIPLFFLVHYSLAKTPICTNGFTLVNGRCLRYFPNARNHRAAENSCFSYDATLVTVKNSIDNRAVSTFVGNAASSIWMGLFCFNMDVTNCLWDDGNGTAQGYNNFMNGSPQIESGKCVYISLMGSSSGRWYSGNCDLDSRPFVCELPITFEDDCSNNYNGFCYSYNPPASFVRAQQNCENQCGSIVSILSPNENRYVGALFPRYESNDMIIGATWTTKDTYSWFDGSPWNFNQINPASPKKNCLAMVTSLNDASASGSWYPIVCYSAYGYLCKRPAGVQCPQYPPVTVTPAPSNPSGCNSTIMSFGTITSPNFPMNYNNITSCNYLLTTLGSYNVMLKFNKFYTDMKNDFVTLYDGDSTKSPVIAKYSGYYEWPFFNVSTGNSMLVTFRSNSTFGYYGFTAIASSYVHHD